jgi:hypothetical protein
MESVTGIRPPAIAYRHEMDVTGSMAVYDMELQDWRAFRIEKVSTVITPSLGEVRTDGTDRLA